MGELFLNQQHPISKRYAILEDNGTCFWLYITERESLRPVSDVWVYSRTEAPPLDRVSSFRPAPPAAVGYAAHHAQIGNPTAHQWSLLWPSDGEAVAIAMDDQVLAFALASGKPGCSRHLA